MQYYNTTYIIVIVYYLIDTYVLCTYNNSSSTHTHTQHTGQHIAEPYREPYTALYILAYPGLILRASYSTQGTYKRISINLNTIRGHI